MIKIGTIIGNILKTEKERRYIYGERTSLYGQRHLQNLVNW